MAKEFLTDAEVELEIARLLESDTVKLAKAEQRLKYRRRQYLYQLRWMEKLGKELESQGKTLEDIKSQYNAMELDETR